MKTLNIIRQSGLYIFLLALVLFTGSIWIGNYQISQEVMETYVAEKGIQSELFLESVNATVVGKEFTSSWSLHHALDQAVSAANSTHKANGEWGKVIWSKSSEMAFVLGKRGAGGSVFDNKGMWLFLTFGLGILGGLMFILPGIWLLGPAGIKNNNVFFNPATNRGWIGWIAMIWLVLFYCILYFMPHLAMSWTFIVEPVKDVFAPGGASQWFLYGLLYCTVMLVMGIRMIIKYRHSKYHIVRTFSVLFFQIVFAFLLVELLPLFQLPAVDFKNAWPLDYDFLFDWNVLDLLRNEAYGKFGLFVFVWGIFFSLILVPVFVYFFGKRWYCSWVCGCGGLAETLGDPYRQLSDKSVKAWKFERYIVHGVLLFAILMTVWVGYHSYNVLHDAEPNDSQAVLLGISAHDVRSWYSLLIGSIFSGVIGTGFYPTFGNRVWCRFGCPLAAYMGIVQRFKSRFRITTNGGQCISCGNCSTYCEQGIDVRWYAQRGQNIVRASCVGCGVCSSVCPRGVLKLENGPEEGRINDNPILIGNGEAIIRDTIG